MSSGVADDERETVAVTHEPPRALSAAAVVAAVISTLTSAPFSILAIPLGLGGAVFLAAGLFMRADRSWVTFGTAGLLLSVVISGMTGTEIELLLISAAAAGLAWDFGQHALSLGEQLGREPQTWRNEALHASASTMVAMLTAAFGYGVYSVFEMSAPVAATMLISIGLVVLIWANRT